MDRFDTYSMYVISWGKGSAPASKVAPPDPEFASAALATGIGAYQHARSVPIMSLDAFDRLVALVGGAATIAPDDDESDVGPTERDERQRADAVSRLRELIRASGATDTGDRWLFDAAAEEIVRLRGELDIASRTLDKHDDSAERRRVEIDALKDAARRGSHEAREQGAAEMRERAAAWCDEEASQKNKREQYLEASALWHAYHQIRALPISPAPAHVDPAVRKADTTRALIAIGVPAERAEQAARIAEEEGGATPEVAHSAVLRLAQIDGPSGFMREGVDAARLLRDRVRGMVQRSAALGPAVKVVHDRTAGQWWDPVTGAGGKGRVLRPVPTKPAWAEPTDELSPEDAETLRGAGWTRDADGIWIGPFGSVLSEGRPIERATLRDLARALREKETPAAAHGTPGRVTGEEVATAGPSSVAEEAPGAQGVLRCLGCGSERGPADKPHACAPQALPKPARVEAGQRWRVDFRDIDGTTEDRTVEDVGDEHARLGGGRGVTYQPIREMLSSPRFTFLGPAPTPQGPGPQREGEAEASATDLDKIEALSAEVAVSVARGEERQRAREANPWRGIEHRVHRHPLDQSVWCVVSVEPNHGATFTGARAEARAREYAAWVSAPDATEPPNGPRPPEPTPDDTIRDPREDEPTMRIERRADGEWLVGAGEANDCEETPPGDDPDDWRNVCTHHHDGQHVSCGARAADGAMKIDARWPIAPAQEERDRQREIAIRNGEEGAPGSETVFDVNSRVRLTFPRKAESRAVLATVAELLGLPDDELVADDRIAAHEAGIREGERRAKAKAEELHERWRGLMNLDARDVDHDDAGAAANARGWVRCRGVCMRDLRAAFNLPTDGQPPTGGEPAPEDGGGFPEVVPPEVEEQIAEIATRAGERVGDVLAHRRDRITADLGRVIRAAITENLLPHEIAHRALRWLEHAYGFNPGALPAPEERRAPTLDEVARMTPVQQRACSGLLESSKQDEAVRRALPRSASGAASIRRCVSALRAACLNTTADKLERGQIAPSDALRSRHEWHLSEKLSADDAKVIAELEAAVKLEERVAEVLRTGRGCADPECKNPEHGPAPPADADERWQPGAAWEYKSAINGLAPERFMLDKTWEGNGGVYVQLSRDEGLFGVTTTSRLMTEERGWRYVGRYAWGRPLAEEPDPLAEHPNAAVERDERSAIERAHADGIVEGLRRAEKIVRAVESKQYDVEESFHVLREDIAEEIAKAERDAAPADRQPPVDRAALLALAEGWETRGSRMRSDAADQKRAEALRCADAGGERAYQIAARDLRRLLDAPRGLGGGEREAERDGPTRADSTALAAAQDGSAEPHGLSADRARALVKAMLLHADRLRGLSDGSDDAYPNGYEHAAKDVARAAGIDPSDTSPPRWGWWAMACRRRALLVDWLEAQRPTVAGEEIDDALVGAACDLLRGSTPDGDVPPGPGGAPHGGGAGQGVVVVPMADVRDGELACPCGDILVEGAWPWPPGGRCLYCCTCRSSYELGTLRELCGPNDPPRPAAEAQRDVASDIQERRISHGGCIRLPREMLDALGVRDGDPLWFLRSEPGGRWEAWRADELDQTFGLPGEPAHGGATDLFADAVAMHNALATDPAARAHLAGESVPEASPADDGGGAAEQRLITLHGRVDMAAEDVASARACLAQGQTEEATRFVSAADRALRGMRDEREAPAAPDREQLGREVHEVARARAQETGLDGLPWDEVNRRDRETACRIGERLFTLGVRHGRARRERDNARFAELARLLEDDIDGARVLLDELARDLGEVDPRVVAARWELRMAEGRPEDTGDDAFSRGREHGLREAGAELNAVRKVLGWSWGEPLIVAAERMRKDAAERIDELTRMWEKGQRELALLQNRLDAAEARDVDLLVALQDVEAERQETDAPIETFNLAVALHAFGVTSAGIERDGVRHVAHNLLTIIELQGDTLQRLGREARTSRPFQPTEEQAHLSALLVGCAHAGMTEEQTIAELWRALRALEVHAARLAELAPLPRYVVRAVPRLAPVTPGPLSDLADRIAGFLADAFSEPSDGELRGRAIAIRVLQMVDEHIRSVAPPSPPQGPSGTPETPPQDGSVEIHGGATTAAALANRWLTPRLNMISRLRYPSGWTPEQIVRARAVGRTWRAATRQLCDAFGIPAPQPDPSDPSVGHARLLLASEDAILETPGATEEHEPEPPTVGVDLGIGPATTAAAVLERQPDSALRPLATFEGADAERRARDFISRLPAEPAPEEAAAPPPGAVKVVVRPDGWFGLSSAEGPAAVALAEGLAAPSSRAESVASLPGPRIELRNGAEVTIESHGYSRCGERGPAHGNICTMHIDGQHVSEGARTGPGSWHVLERWPIEPAKPPTVAPGQRWTCAGVDGVLEVFDRVEFDGGAVEVGLRPAGSTGPATVRAREVDMLGLPHWTFVGGPPPLDHEAEQSAIVDRMARLLRERGSR